MWCHVPYVSYKVTLCIDPRGWIWRKMVYERPIDDMVIKEKTHRQNGDNSTCCYPQKGKNSHIINAEIVGYKCLSKVLY